MKTCLVGCGGIAAVHGSVLTSGIDTEFVAAADIKPEKAQTYAENFHTKPYPSLESMLEAEKPDVLHICTPHYLHVPMAIYSPERNINVFMEKPPAISFDQLEELKKAAAKSEAQLGFCYQNRYNASIRAAKEMFESAEGKALMKEWGIADTYAGVACCILGYADGPLPEAKPRKNDYIVRV